MNFDETMKPSERSFSKLSEDNKIVEIQLTEFGN